MSGFITIYNTNGEPSDKQQIHALTQTLQFRGPDHQSTWVNGSIGMGHTLFQTTNEAKYERQPATLDGKTWITSSARIDGREDLVNKLNMTNEIDLTQTPDSKLILLAYRKWSEDCLEHLLGDFAFVIWDSQEKKIFCARDRFGTNQLYYAQKHNSLIFCNSLFCIRQHQPISNTLNDKAIAGFLLFGDHTWIDKSITILKDVNTLLPAHKLVYQSDKILINRYWDIPPDLPLLKYKNNSDYIEHFHEIFKTSVADRIRTTKPITISMSGGLDSSAIAATVRQLEKEKRVNPSRVDAVTAVFDRLLPCKERYYAGIVAKYLDIPIHYLNGDNSSLIEPMVLTTRPLEIDTFTYWLDIKKTFASQSRVVLTGASADNLLEFSSPFSTLNEANHINALWNLYKLRRRYNIQFSFRRVLSFLKKMSKGNVLISPYPCPEWFTPEFENRVKLKELWGETLAWTPSPLNKRHPKAHNSLTGPDWNTDDIIMQSDFTFAEERDPFLDLRLVEFMFSLPPVPWFFNKHILRESMRELLPRDIIMRPKTPLGNRQTALLKKNSSKWIGEWKARPELTQYIKEENIPILTKPDLNTSTCYQALRTITLNSWLNSFFN